MHILSSNEYIKDILIKLNFMIKDEIFFGKYIKIWEKVSNIIKKHFNSELIYNTKYLKAGKKFKFLYTSNID